MVEDKLHLPVGTPIHLQQEELENPIRYTVKLLGYYPGKGLIVTNTEHDGKTVLLTDGTKLVARTVQGSAVQGFRVKVVQTSMTPYPHLHLSYPDDIEISVVRDACRVSTKQPALAKNTKNDDKNHEAMILDLSASGAKIATRVPIADLDEVIELKMELNAAGSDEKLTLLGVVKSVDYRRGDRDRGLLPLHYYGLMFQGVNRFQKLVLNTFVAETSIIVTI